MVSMLRFVVSMCLLGIMFLYIGPVPAQNYPDKPLRIITTPPGGGADVLTRVIAQGISGPLGQPVVVENRPSNIIGELVAKMLPDGYTMAFVGNSFWVSPLMQKTRYDPVRDFSPITRTTVQPNVLVVHSSVPVTSVNELIELAKSRPGALNYSSSGIGGSSHLAAELFKTMAGVNIVGINYNGTGPALNALISGEVHLLFSTAGTLAPFVKSGKLKMLAVTTSRPTTLIPGVPTVAATGLPGYEAITMQAILAPAKTPVAVIKRLNQEIVRVLNGSDVKEQFFKSGVELSGSSPDEFRATLKSEIAKWGKVIRDAGIKAD